jgi:hypothetical protein
MGAHAKRSRGLGDIGLIHKFRALFRCLVLVHCLGA